MTATKCHSKPEQIKKSKVEYSNLPITDNIIKKCFTTLLFLLRATVKYKNRNYTMC